MSNPASWLLPKMRVVKRYFVAGKGYATIANACRAAAKREYASMYKGDRFAHDETAEYVWSNRKIGTPTRCPNCQVNYTEEMETPEFGFLDCRRKRDEWLRQRTKEYMDAYTEVKA